MREDGRKTTNLGFAEARLFSRPLGAFESQNWRGGKREVKKKKLKWRRWKN